MRYLPSFIWKPNASIFNATRPCFAAGHWFAHQVRAVLAVTCLLGLGSALQGATFTGDLDVSSNPTVVIPITLPQDGSLNLEITTSDRLNLNQNDAVGVSEGIIVYDSTSTNRLFGTSQAQGATASYVITGLGAGNYFVRLTAIGHYPPWGRGNYTMTATQTPDPLPAEAEPNDDFDNALVVPLGASVTGHLGYLGPQSVIENQDFWKVQLPVDGTLHLDIATGPRLNLNRNLALDTPAGVMVYDENRTTCFYTASQGQNTTNLHTIDKLKAGVYYVRLIVLGPDRAYYGSYQLTARQTPEAQPNDAEPNDEPVQSRLLTLNETSTGHLGYYGAGAGTNTDHQDWWRVTLPEPGELQLEITTSPRLQLNINSFVGASHGIAVYDADAATMLFGATQAQSKTNVHAAQRLTAGTYYVRLTKFEPAGHYGSYTLKPQLLAAPQDPEPNDTSVQAGLATLGSSVQGNLGYRGGGQGLVQDQLDWWRFAMPSTGQLQLVITTTSRLNLNANTGLSVTEGITVFTSEADGSVGTRLFGTVQGQGTTKTYPLNLAAGNYFLRLVKLGEDGYWGTYSAAFNYVGAPIITSPATARGMTGQPFSYTITVLGGGSFAAQNLPPGLSLDASSGLISGTLGTPATHNVTMLATNAHGSASAPLSITVRPFPQLAIQSLEGRQVVLSWPVDYPDFVLQMADALANAPAVWEPAPGTPAAGSTMLAVTNALGETPRFYRLRQN